MENLAPKPKNPFDHHVPNSGQVTKISEIRNAYKIVNEVLKSLKADPKTGAMANRYVALAMTDLEGSAMWAVKAAIFNDDIKPEPKAA